MWSQVYHGINITWHYYIQHSTINSELTKKHNSSSLVSCGMSSVSTFKKKIHDTENVLYLCWNHRDFVFAVLLSHMTNTLVAVSLSSPQIMLFVLPKQHNYMANRLSSNLLPQPTLKATHSCNIDIFCKISFPKQQVIIENPMSPKFDKLVSDMSDILTNMADVLNDFILKYTLSIQHQTLLNWHEPNDNAKCCGSCVPL